MVVMVLVQVVWPPTSGEELDGGLVGVDGGEDDLGGGGVPGGAGDQVTRSGRARYRGWTRATT